MFGLHGFIAPTVETKFNQISLRAKIGYNSFGMGLEYEKPMAGSFGFFNNGDYSGSLLFSLASNYQIRPAQTGFGLYEDLETIKPLSFFAFFGSKVYFNSTCAVALKFGATAAEREWEY
ncbi:MAG: hypothetical protein KDC92_07835, partial [Bacteroidetes bacterium]|nr:hypothetical protein [Bacteroidota bacterium]